ncbi:MAG: protein TolR [Bdellovibrionaceae bacterium]|nr:protein TolR [Pseudobdellovibrionaceae bacterium]
MGMSGGSRNSRMVQSEINVTPFVDVMLVLLIIFMVTAPMLQQGIDVELPETKASGVDTSEEPFVLSIRKDGKIYVDKVQIPGNELGGKLKAIMKTRKNKQIYIKADKSVPYGAVAETMAEVRSAGIYSIGLVTLPK